MKWTQKHSKNAVAARARRRLQKAENVLDDRRRVPMPRKGPARFTLQLRDHKHGDSITLTLHKLPWPNRYICQQGEFSAAHIGRVITLILTNPS